MELLACELVVNEILVKVWQGLIVLNMVALLRALFHLRLHENNN